MSAIAIDASLSTNHHNHIVLTIVNFCPPFYSPLKIPLDVVVVSTDSDGFLNRDEHRVDAIFDRTLRESLKDVFMKLETAESDTDCSTEMTYTCYEGNYNVGIVLVLWTRSLSSAELDAGDPLATSSTAGGSGLVHDTTWCVYEL